MSIVFHEKSKVFHLYNDAISYIMMVMENGHMGQLYCGKRIHDREDFSYLLEKAPRPMSSYVYENERLFSLEHIRQEFPVYGTTDYRHPAVEVRHPTLLREAHLISLRFPALHLLSTYNVSYRLQD